MQFGKYARGSLDSTCRRTHTTMRKSLQGARVSFLSTQAAPAHCPPVLHFCFATILYLVPLYLPRERMFFCTSSSFLA